MVGLGQKGVARVGGNCLKYLKRRRKLDQGVGVLKGGWEGLEPPYEL